MMKKNIIFAGLFIVIGIIIIGIYKYTTDIQEDILISKFIKNNSFDSGFHNDIPYKKGDELEFSFIIENNNINNKKIFVDKEKIKHQIDITEISVDGIVQKKLESIDIDTKNAKQINIKGIAKNNKIISSTSDIKNINIIGKTIDITDDTLKKGKINPIDFKLNSKKIVINTDTFSSNIDNLLIITFEKPEIVDFIMIGEKTLVPNFIEKNKIYINIKKDIFETGEYFFALILKNGSIIMSDYSLKMILDKKSVSIANITPKEIKNDLDRNIILQGKGFQKIIGVQLSNSIILKKTSFEIINDMVMSVKVPAGLTTGRYHLNLMDINSIYEGKDTFFTLIQ